MITDKHRSASHWYNYGKREGFKDCPFSDLVGKRITEIEGLQRGSEEVLIATEDGSVYRMHHITDCCEQVDIDDIDGDNADLLDAVVIAAETASNEKNPKNQSDADYGVFEWTFYTIQTTKGHVWIRWYGTSNGYYSTSVSFEKWSNEE